MVGKKGMVETVLSCRVSGSEIKCAPRCAHASAHSTDTHRHGTAGWDSEGLTVDVPAEEVMLHQHVLHAFLQRPLLLLLGKKRGKLIVEIIPRGFYIKLRLNEVTKDTAT